MVVGLVHLEASLDLSPCTFVFGLLTHLLDLKLSLQLLDASLDVGLFVCAALLHVGLLELGVLLQLGLGRLGQAETLLRRAIATDEAIPETWNNLGVVLMEKGDAAEAEQIFRRAYALDNGESDSIRDNLRLALAKIENQGYDEADQEYKMVRRGSSEFLLRRIP